MNSATLDVKHAPRSLHWRAALGHGFVVYLLRVDLLTALEQRCSIDRSKQMNESGNQPCPSGLVACSQSCSIVAMKILVEQQIIAPVRVSLEFFRASIQ